MASLPKKKRPFRVFFAAVLLTLLYFGLFPYPLHRELVARPAWAVKIPDTTPATTSGGPATAAPFLVGGTFGFVSPDGTVLYTARQLYGVALSTAGFVSYTRLGTDWIMQDPGGARLLTFSGNGYPLLSPDGRRIFNVKSDLSGIIEIDRSGERAWSRDFPSLMTSLSISADTMLVGLLNGGMIVLNAQGAAVFTHVPRGSRIPVIVGTAISPDSSLIAGMSGIEPQFITVLRRAGTGYDTVAKQRLSSDFRREARLAFSPDSRWLAFEEPRGVGLYDPGTGSFDTVALDGTLAGIAFPGHGRCGAFIARGADATSLTVVAPFTGPLLSGRFPGPEVTLGSIDGQLLVGWGGRLLRIDVEAL